MRLLLAFIVKNVYVIIQLQIYISIGDGNIASSIVILLNVVTILPHYGDENIKVALNIFLNISYNLPHYGDGKQKRLTPIKVSAFCMHT